MGFARSMAGCLALGLFLCPWGGVSAEQAKGEPEVWIETERWPVELPAGTVLRVSNVLGDVRGRSSGDDKLLVVATIQRFEAGQEDAEVLISHEADEVVVTTRYPSAENRRPDGRLNGRIDLSLLVPAGSKMIVETGPGLIEVKGVDRDLAARTTSGRLRVTTSRALTAETRGGELVAVIRKPSAASPARLVTSGGSLRVDVLNLPDLTLSAKTAAPIATSLGDYPGARVRETDGVSQLRLGKPPWLVEVSSAKGPIEIRARPPHELR